MSRIPSTKYEPDSFLIRLSSSWCAFSGSIHSQQEVPTSQVQTAHRVFCVLAGSLRPCKPPENSSAKGSPSLPMAGIVSDLQSLLPMQQTAFGKPVKTVPNSAEAVLQDPALFGTSLQLSTTPWQLWLQVAAVAAEGPQEIRPPPRLALMKVFVEMLFEEEMAAAWDYPCRPCLHQQACLAEHLQDRMAWQPQLRCRGETLSWPCLSQR